MSCPVITFFNNKGGVGKTSLVYHIAWMMALQGRRVVVCDLDPQANLTTAFVPEEDLVTQMETASDAPRTIYRCIEPLTKVGDIRNPELTPISQNLALIQGDIALSSFEDQLSEQWPKAADSGDHFRPFRVLTAFWQVMQLGAKAWNADVILADVGPNLGAINRSVLIASDFLVVPLGADLFSLQGLRNLGPTLTRWRRDWKIRLGNWQAPDFPLPEGHMKPLGYVVQQHSVRLSRPVLAYDRWINRIPAEYARQLLDDKNADPEVRPANDPNCLATLKHYRSLVPMAQESRKPIFSLTVADGAIGNHLAAVKLAYDDFKALAGKILARAGCSTQ
ncbi:ParA family protein [Tahibacter amnicola]|uniref:AAA family ATPase n=1 Tax=Tahibacter amnicola TaxID=2976241 RepID=A0ABY6BDT9_9GAMM|nr:AAA family ATPase [Tahibacter amnicola]UXI68009.1 AAA family ATPase [Tahibacter amnicola]